MQFYDLALTHLNLLDQQQLRQMLNVAAIRAYLSSKPGIHENFTFNHHNMEYEWGHSGSTRIAELYTHTQPPLLRLKTNFESTATSELEQPDLTIEHSNPRWKEIQIDESIDAAAVLHHIDQAYAYFIRQFDQDTTLLPLLDRSLPTLETLRRLCELHQIENPEPILALAQPGIRVLTRRAEERASDHHFRSLGGSHFGGAPDLPNETAWPQYKGRPMAFLGQINMEDIKALPGHERLPKHGLLYFFSAIGWGEDYADDLDHDDAANTQVIFYDAPLDWEHIQTALRPQGMPPIGTWGWGLYPYATLQFVAHLSLPHPDEMISWDQVNRDTYEAIYYDFMFMVEDYFRHKANHQLLGFLRSINHIVPDEGETLLIQFDSDYWETDFEWGDGGMMYFLLPKEDLQRQDFSRCRCGYESG